MSWVFTASAVLRHAHDASHPITRLVRVGLRATAQGDLGDVLPRRARPRTMPYQPDITVGHEHEPAVACSACSGLMASEAEAVAAALSSVC